MCKLFFTIKLPRAGGTTLCKRWQKGELDIINNRFSSELLSENITRLERIPRVVVTPDAWRLALGHRYNWYVEPVVFAHVQVAIRALLQDYDVLVDDTNTSEESIKRLFEIDPEATYALVDTPINTCIDRAYATGQQDLVPVMERMDHNIGNLYLKHYIYNNFQELRRQVARHSSRKVVV